MDLKAKFNAAASFIQEQGRDGHQPSLSPTNEQKLKIYAFFKQAQDGDIQTPSPSLFDPAAKAKWDAWKEVQGWSQDEAMDAYITIVESLAPKEFRSFLNAKQEVEHDQPLVNIDANNKEDNGVETPGDQSVGQLDQARILQKYFEDVDGPFLGTRTTSAEQNLTWKCSHMPVKQTFRLPIPVDIAGSIVEYRFQTFDYDIGFSVEFETLDENGTLQSNIVLEYERYDSHVEPFIQEIELDQPGTLVLVWDNAYSWLREKQLSYSVTLQAPSPVGIDKAKCERAYSFFSECVTSLTTSTLKQEKLKQHKSNVTKELTFITKQIEQLNQELSKKTEQLQNVLEEEVCVQEELELSKLKIAGFSFRLFSAPILCHIFSFGGLPQKAQWVLVCADWSSIIASMLQKDGSKEKTENEGTFS